MNEGLQDGIEDCGDGAGTGAGTGVETRRRTPDGNEDGNGDGSEDSSGDGNGDKDNGNGNEDRIGGGRKRDEEAQETANQCRRHVGNGRDLGGKRENCRNERFGLLLPLITILPVVTKDLLIPPRFTPYDFLSRCKFSILTTRQPMVEFYLLRFPRFPLRKKEHKSYLVRIELTTSALAGVQIIC